MASKNKSDKKGKPVFTILTHRFFQDSSQSVGEEQIVENNQNEVIYQFPLEGQLQQIHDNPATSELSNYIKFLEKQVKHISNDVEYEYHQLRETIIFLGQSTGDFQIPRKKADQQMQKWGVVRLYDPVAKKILSIENQAIDVGSIAIDSIKRKIQHNWELQVSDQLQRSRRRQRQAQKKRAKQLQQLDKDLQKIMIKRKALKDQIQLKSQLSINSNNSSGNRAAKGEQKKQKAALKNSDKSKSKSNPRSSEIQSSSIHQNGYNAGAQSEVEKVEDQIHENFQGEIKSENLVESGI